jgi:plasmid stabilization system protein ParE
VKKYDVIVTPEAQAGIREAFLYIQERSPLNAARWLQGLYAEIDTLEPLSD